MIRTRNSMDTFVQLFSKHSGRFDKEVHNANSDNSGAQGCGISTLFKKVVKRINIFSDQKLPRVQCKAVTEIQKLNESPFPQNTIRKSEEEKGKGEEYEEGEIEEEDSDEEEDMFRQFEVPIDSQLVRRDVPGANTQNFIQIQGKNEKILGCVFEQPDSEFSFQNLHLEVLVVGVDGILRQIDPLANNNLMAEEEDIDSTFSKKIVNPVNDNVNDRVAQTYLKYVPNYSSRRKRNVTSNQSKKKGKKRKRKFIRKRLLSTNRSAMSSRRSSLSSSTDDQFCTDVTNYDSYDSGIELQSMTDVNNSACIKYEIEQIGRQNFKSVKYKPSHLYSKIGVRVRMHSIKLMRLRKTYRRHIRHFFKDIGGLTLKSFVRELHIERMPLKVFGLGSYFDRLNRGESLPVRERMQYEWLRLASFQHYTGNGNALSLARNGFYHDPTDGPTSTRCHLCDAIHSTWAYFDNIEAEHRRQFPHCRFHENTRGQSTSIDASLETSPQLHMDPVSTTNRPRNSQESFQDNSPRSEASYSTYTNVLYHVADRFGNSASTRSVSETARALSYQQTRRRVIGDDDAFPLSEPDLPISATPTAGELGICEKRRTTTSACQHSQQSTEKAAQQSRGNSKQKEHRTELNQQVVTGAHGLTTSQQNTGLNVIASSSVSTSNVPEPISLGAARGRTDPTITVVVNNPKYPDYRELDARINSFQGWPDYLDQTARQMAEAGFFFVGVADFTRCFCCGGGLRNWEPGDDPMLEHTRWFPRCEYVNKLKGERYVAAVQRRHQQHMEDQQQELARSRDANRNPPDPMSTEAAAVLREMGYQQERIKDAILTVRRQIGVPDVTTQQVLAWLLDRHEARSSLTSSRSSPTRDAQTLKTENEKLREMQTCKICMERPVNITLLPCGHLVSCEVCAEKLKRCPVCRKGIHGTVKTFKAYKML